MPEKYEKKPIYEFCLIRKTMVRLETIHSAVSMPDGAQAEMKLMPVDCNRASDCKREGISCIFYDLNGIDPCPEAWGE